MAAIVLSQVATSLLAPSIYGTLAAGASIAQSGFLWSVSQGLAGFAGSMVGSAIDRALFGSGAQNVEGPRLNDLTVQSSADGAALPVVYGTYRMAGNVIWSTGLQEIVHREDVGGGSGGGGGSVTTYSYQTDVAVALCAGEITGIRRIWADTKLIFDMGNTAGLAAITASAAQANSIRIYTGTESQAADPLIEAVEGTASAPAYRGTAYVVFEDLQLADFGNRLPNFQFEVVRDTTPTGPAIVGTPWTMTDPTPVRWSPYCVDESGVWFSQYSNGDTSVQRWLLPHGASAPVLAGSISLPTGTTAVGGERYVDSNDPQTVILRGTYGASACLLVAGRLGTFYILGSIDTAVIEDSKLWWAEEYEATALVNYRDLGGGTTGTVDTGVGLNTGANDHIVVTRAPGVVGISGALSGLVKRCGHLINTDDLTYIRTADTPSGDDANIVALSTETGAYFKYTAPNAKIYRSVNGGAWTNETLSGGTADQRFENNDKALIATLADGRLLCLAIQRANPTISYVSDGLLGQGTDTLQTVVEGLLDLAGVDSADHDASALSSDTVRGYVVSRPMAMRGALEPLMAAYHFDLIEQDGQLVAVKRGGAIAATLSTDEMGAAENPDGTLVAVTRNNPTELPSEINLVYPDLGTEYQPGMQYARRLTATHANRVSLNLPLVMTSQEAARLAEILLNVSWWSGRELYGINAPFDHLRLSPSDRVNVPVYGNTVAARLTEVTSGAPGVMQIQAVPDVASLYTGTAVGADTVDLSQLLSASGLTRAYLLDCGMLRDLDNAPGLYVAMAGYTTGWNGGSLYKSNDGGATYGLAVTAPTGARAAMGYATNALGNDGCTVWDRTNSLTVRLYGGATLSSATEAAVLNGANAALVGAHGRWELIQFQTATLNGDGSYTLSLLLRGRRGTDHAAASHAVYDSFVLLTGSTVQDLPLNTSEISATRQYKAVTNGMALEATLSESLTYTGERLECLSPVDLRASRDGSGNITLTWKRRDRVNAGWNDYADIPMSEATEAYEVDIYTTSSYGTVKRTLTGLSSATASYTATQQNIDFGSTQSIIYVRVYQLSATVGRGHYRQGAV